MNKQQKGSKAMFTIDLKIKKKIIKLVVLENDQIGDLGTKLFKLAGIGGKEEGSYLKKLEEELKKIYEQGEVSENIKKKIYKVLDYGKIKVEEGDISKETETPFRILQDSLMMAQEQQHRSNKKKRQFNYDIVQIVQPKISYQRSQKQIKIQDHNVGAMNYAQNNNNRHHHQTNRSRQRVNYQYDIKPPSSYLNQPPSHQPLLQKDQHKPVLPLPVQNQLRTNHNNLQNNLSYNNYHNEQGVLNKDSLTRKYEQLDKRCDEYIIKNINTQKSQSSKPLHHLNHNHNQHQNNNNHNYNHHHHHTIQHNRIQSLNNNHHNTNYNYNRIESINNHTNYNHNNFTNNGNVSNNYTKALHYQRNNGNNNRQYVSYRNNENNYNVLVQKEKENRSKSKDEYSNIDQKFGQLDLTSTLNLRNNYNQKGEGRQIIKNQSQNALVYSNNNNNNYLAKPLQTKNQNLSSSYSQIYLKWPQHYTQMNSNTQKTQQIETTKHTQRHPNILNIKTNIPKEQLFNKSPIKSNIYASPYNMLNDANEPQSKNYYYMNGNDDEVKVNEYDFKRKGTRKYNYLSDQ